MWIGNAKSTNFTQGLAVAMTVMTAEVHFHAVMHLCTCICLQCQSALKLVFSISQFSIFWLFCISVKRSVCFHAVIALTSSEGRNSVTTELYRNVTRCRKFVRGSKGKWPM